MPMPEHAYARLGAESRPLASWLCRLLAVSSRLVLAVALVAALPGLIGCGGDDAEGVDAALRVGRLLATTNPGDRFAEAREVRAFEFPADHGPHDAFASEWWYLTASLWPAPQTHVADSAPSFGVQFTLFRRALDSDSDEPAALAGLIPWRTNQVYMAHLAVTSVAAGTHREFQRFARGHPRLAGVRSQPFAAHIDGWSLESTGPGFAPLRLRAREGRSYVDLELLAGKPLVMHAYERARSASPSLAISIMSFLWPSVQGPQW
jgi:predicted secreted hydrolase